MFDAPEQAWSPGGEEEADCVDETVRRSGGLSWAPGQETTAVPPALQQRHEEVQQARGAVAGRPSNAGSLGHSVANVLPLAQEAWAQAWRGAIAAKFYEALPQERATVLVAAA